MRPPHHLSRPDQGRPHSGMQEQRSPGLPLPERPWMPPLYDRYDIAAVKALRDGRATAEQQQRFLAWLIEHAARTYAPSYQPDSDRDTVFAEGCRHVGLMVVRMINSNVPTNEEQGR